MRCTCLWRHYAHARAVWCSWCALECLSYPYVLVIARAIKGREKVWVVSRFLTTKLPSALLMAVVQLQHTRCPRFRRGTFGYGVTTSPMKRGRVGVRVFMRMHVSMPKLPECICYAVHAQKLHLFYFTRLRARPKRISLGTRSRLDLWLARNFWTSLRFITELDLITTGIIMLYEHYCWKRRLIQALHRWWFSEFPNNVWNYNAD
jgi:hypothetical protein